MQGLADSRQLPRLLTGAGESGPHLVTLVPDSGLRALDEPWVPSPL